jgi:uncharacterized protein YceH (UPF0502 family)
MASFGTLEEVENVLGGLSRGDVPLVELLPARPGQKERRYIQLLSEKSDEPVGTPGLSIIPVPETADTARIATLEATVQSLRSELQSLREEFAAFRKQFE